ncbi:MAG: mannonate dehydratase [Deinococcota bacterium]
MKLGLSHQRPEYFTPEYLTYLKYMGVDSMEVRILTKDASLEYLVHIKNTLENAGIELHEIMLNDLYSSPEICLGLAGRDEALARFKQFIQDLGRAGIHNTTYAWYTGGAYQTGTTTTRGCPTRLFELKDAKVLPYAFDREYNDDEMWHSYEHFIHEMLPVAEAANVTLQLHPNDPPVNHQGVARIFRSTAAFRRAMEISQHSPHAGILFCVGCWAEMFDPNSQEGSEDILSAIQEFGAQRHIKQVHFRNIDTPMPNFKETFPDNGYVDMPAIVRALADVGFDGMLVPDHVPDTSAGEGGKQAGEAFILGYIRGLIQASRAA